MAPPPIMSAWVVRYRKNVRPRENRNSLSSVMRGDSLYATTSIGDCPMRWASCPTSRVMHVMGRWW